MPLVDKSCIFMQDLCNFMHMDRKSDRLAADSRSAPARRSLLARIIRDKSVGRQAELVELLRKQGYPATQSSISRDLRELGVAKMGDRYMLPAAALSPRTEFPTLRQFVTAVLKAGGNLVVLKTRIGSAQSVALAIDAAQWPEVIGTISGDDTIFIATASAAAQRKLGATLHDIFGI
jgi:transcriptional regulator of arginine metabolism